MLRNLRVAQPIAHVYAVWRRSLPFVRGSGVLYRLLRLLERRGAPRPIVAGEDGIRLEVGTDCVCMGVLVHGAWEREQTARMRDLTGRGAVWFDVGAHVGYFSLLASRWVGSSGRVFAFEPVPATRRRLRRNLRLNRATNVSVVACACGAAGGSGRIAVGDDPAIARLDDAGTLDVMVTTIDDFVRGRVLERLDVLKIDAEDHDLDVLRGAEGTLERFRPTVIVEVSEHESAQSWHARVREFLERRGYRCELAHNESSWDLIAVPGSSAGVRMAVAGD